MLELLKKIAIYLIPILGIIYGYHFMTGKSIATLPGEIVGKLQQKNTATESTNPHYYRDTAKDMPKD
ncbi:MAG: hypothetical protein KJ630_17185 [Proteobacteria bacterium]|nr:hypothetical protein [Pseudomonadota bacterium]